jgi:FkbM family methyltransferase
LKQRLRPLKNRLRNLKHRLRPVKNRLRNLKHRLRPVKNRLRNLKQRFQLLSNELRNLKQSVQPLKNRMRKAKNTFEILGPSAYFLFVVQQFCLRWSRDQRFMVLRSKYAKHPVKCRTKSSDIHVFVQIFIDLEYSCLDDVPTPDLIIDCGANIGCSSAYFLSRFPQCRIIAVEPDPKNFEVLGRNLAPYGDRVKLLHSAVWSHPARLTIAENVYRDGGDWARQVRECRPDEKAGFTAVGIEEILKQSGQSRISILKIDIEGAEAVIFSKNYDAWIDKVDNIVIELHDDSMFGRCTPVFERAIAGRGFSKSHCGELTVCKSRES